MTKKKKKKPMKRKKLTSESVRKEPYLDQSIQTSIDVLLVGPLLLKVGSHIGLAGSEWYSVCVISRCCVRVIVLVKSVFVLVRICFRTL